MRQFCIGKVLTALLHVDFGGVLALLCQLLNDFQGIGIGQGIIGSRSGLGFEEYFLMFLRVSKATLSLALIAFLMSSLTLSNKSILFFIVLLFIMYCFRLKSGTAVGLESDYAVAAAFRFLRFFGGEYAGFFRLDLDCRQVLLSRW